MRSPREDIVHNFGKQTLVAEKGESGSKPKRQNFMKSGKLLPHSTTFFVD